MKTERRLITAALPYINNVPHLGHIVGSHLPADIFARFCRTKGYETLFVGGTDEHGSTSEIAASEVGVDLETFGTKLHQEHKKIYNWFNISYDVFSRTTSKTHISTTQDFFKKIYTNGFITSGKIKVFYSPKENRYLPDRYIRGTCPKCGYEEATGDQCEHCTAVLDPTQLINPRSSISGEKIEIREREHLFLRLDKLSNELERWIKSQTTWRPQVTSLALGWIKEGLKERCITRDLKHGVPVPLKGFEDKVFYVWFDAPIGYLSFTKEAAPSRWQKFWEDRSTKIYHFLGKDNIPFHTIFWPGMLLAHKNINLPYQVIGLQYLNYEGGKFSKSQKRGVFCEKLPGTSLNSDVMRAYLTFLIPETADSEFRWEDFQRRVNTEIIGNLGNFINRTLHLIKQKNNQSILRPKEKELEQIDKEIHSSIKIRVKKTTEFLEQARLREAFSEILSLSADGNKYLSETKPWSSENSYRVNVVLYHCAAICRSLAILVSPYLPLTSKKIWNQLAFSGEADAAGNWDSAAEIALPDNHKIGEPEPLFERITSEEIDKIKKISSHTTEVKDLFKIKNFI